MRKKIKLSTKKFSPVKYESPFPVQIAKGTAVFFCTSSSALSKDRHVVLLSVVAMKCTVYRTVFLRKPLVTREQAVALIKRWAKLLPMDELK